MSIGLPHPPWYSSRCARSASQNQGYTTQGSLFNPERTPNESEEEVEGEVSLLLLGCHCEEDEGRRGNLLIRGLLRAPSIRAPLSHYSGFPRNDIENPDPISDAV